MIRESHEFTNLNNLKFVFAFLQKRRKRILRHVNKTVWPFPLAGMRKNRRGIKGRTSRSGDDVSNENETHVTRAKYERVFAPSLVAVDSLSMGLTWPRPWISQHERMVWVSGRHVLSCLIHAFHKTFRKLHYG